MMNTTRSALTLLLATSLISGCSWFRNSETEEERQAPRRLDNTVTNQTWWCYGKEDQSWDWEKEADPSKVRSIEPRAPQEAAAMPLPQREPERAVSAPPSLMAQSVTPPAAETPILSQPADYFAVQLIALKEKDGVLSYAQANGIEDPLMTEIETNGSRWHVLLLGVYPDESSARTARDDWERTKSLKVKPWIRKLGPLQQAIRLASNDA